MFHSRTGILGLDFLEDNDALISVKHKRMQLRNHWVSLSPRTRDPSALYVVRNRESTRNQSEVRDNLSVGRKDPDQILSTPSDQQTLSPSIAPGATASPRIPTIVESAEEDSPKCPSCEHASGNSHSNDSMLKMLLSCAQLTQKLEECVSTLATALNPSPTPPTGARRRRRRCRAQSSPPSDSVANPPTKEPCQKECRANSKPGPKSRTPNPGRTCRPNRAKQILCPKS